MAKRKTQKTPNPGIVAAIKAAGSQQALAKLMKVKQPAVNYWLHYFCPPVRARELEDKFGIPRAETCPDVFD